MVADSGPSNGNHCPPKSESASQRQSIEKRARRLKFVFEALCSLRIEATKLDLPFLSYLVEVAALEARNEHLQVLAKKSAESEMPEKD